MCASRGHGEVGDSACGRQLRSQAAGWQPPQMALRKKGVLKLQSPGHQAVKGPVVGMGVLITGADYRGYAGR